MPKFAISVEVYAPLPGMTRKEAEAIRARVYKKIDELFLWDDAFDEAIDNSDLHVEVTADELEDDGEDGGQAG